MTMLTGKTALVTGGSRGLGEFIASGLVKAGARVFVSSRKAEACDATAEALGAFGTCESLPADLSTLAGVQALAEAVSSRAERLDILVNNAGATWGAPLQAFPESGWDRVMDLNVKSLFFLTQALIPKLKAAARPDDPARIINIGSIAGDRAGAGENFSYVASKAAVHHMTRQLAAQLGPQGISVNAIAPGPFDTKMMEFALKDPEARARIERTIPLGRVGGADDISDLAVFLCGPGAKYVSGAVIPLDGGAAAAR